MDAAGLNLRGILKPKDAAQHFQLTRYLPSPDLRFFIALYWIVRWDLRGQPPYVQELVSNPSVDLVIDPYMTGLFGVMSEKFAYTLKDTGVVFGAKFRPGAFYPFVKTSVSQFTNRCTPLGDLFGDAGRALETAMLATHDDHARIILIESFLRERLPEEDETVARINAIIDHIRAERDITRVDELARRVHISKRTLQRLFNQYVGESPKWVIKQFRLQDAAAQLEKTQGADLPQIAYDLGYFDQAHFIRDFRSLVGRTPAAYARR